METSRNLLFGVMALRAGLIDAEQFASACRRWSAHRETPLAEFLLEREWLLAADREHLDYLVQRAVASHGGREDEALKALADVTVWRSLASLNDPDLRRWLLEILPGASWLEREDQPAKRGLVGLGVLILVLLGIAGIGGVVLLVGSMFWLRGQRMEAMLYAEEARAQAERARDMEVQARQTSEKNFQTARTAVDQVLTQTAEQKQKREEMNKAVMQRALEFYEKSQKEAKDQVGKEKTLALVTRRLAQVRDGLGQTEKARETYEEALALLAKQAAATPKDSEVRRELAATYLSLGRMQRKAKKHEEAEQRARQAVEHYTKLVAELPADAEIRGDLATAYDELSQVYQDNRRPAEAERTLRQAIELLRNLAVEAPNMPDYQEQLKAAMKKLETLRPEKKKE